jgi:hypothetical protein
MCGSLNEHCNGGDTCTPCFIVWTLKGSRFRILVNPNILYIPSSRSFNSIENCGLENRSRTTWYRTTGPAPVPLYDEYRLVEFCILVEWIRDNPCRVRNTMVQALRDDVTRRILYLLGITIADEALIDGVWHCLLTGEPDSDPVVVVSADLIGAADRACPDDIVDGRVDIARFIHSLDATAALIAKTDWVLLISDCPLNSESPFFGLTAMPSNENDTQLDIPF